MSTGLEKLSRIHLLRCAREYLETGDVSVAKHTKRPLQTFDDICPVFHVSKYLYVLYELLEQFRAVWPAVVQNNGEFMSISHYIKKSYKLYKFPFLTLKKMIEKDYAVSAVDINIFSRAKNTHSCSCILIKDGSHFIIEMFDPNGIVVDLETYGHMVSGILQEKGYNTTIRVNKITQGLNKLGICGHIMLLYVYYRFKTLMKNPDSVFDAVAFEATLAGCNLKTAKTGFCQEYRRISALFDTIDFHHCGNMSVPERMALFSRYPGLCRMPLDCRVDNVITYRMRGCETIAFSITKTDLTHICTMDCGKNLMMYGNLLRSLLKKDALVYTVSPDLTRDQFFILLYAGFRPVYGTNQMSMAVRPTMLPPGYQIGNIKLSGSDIKLANEIMPVS